ncbi:sulfurtransferase TusA family protein [Motiliproteus sediminis]|uniref:sulfurtransferase TusA family protein n=1 Tax=Motiliproteus sediminis TaxID=1468178 RepID=UPI001AEFBD46
MSIELDLRGLVCPLPLIRLTARLEELDGGCRCLVLADDPGFVDDLPDWCAATGHRLVTLDLVEGVCRAEVEKLAAT